MKQKTFLKYLGEKGQVGSFPIIRSLPNIYAKSIGHFVFLDLIPLKIHLTSALQKAETDNSHPHRGIATFSYVIEGNIEHFDSVGNRGIVKSGGIQWMNAGNGIIHDEKIIFDNNEKHLLILVCNFGLIYLHIKK